jgi:redox-sensitive bicupin YhaK (pirin superfamily)
VPGFPQHPHRGFEVVTVTRQGVIDHSDSLGATARYGQGDVQWLTAGAGISHTEMFPLLNQKEGNPTELFQIWLNLPPKSKMVKPHFSMFWAPQLPIKKEGGVEWRIVTGNSGDLKAPAPPPDSWASEKNAEVAIWTLKLDPGARFSLPAAGAGLNRCLYFFEGKTLKVAGEEQKPGQRFVLKSDETVELENGAEASQCLVLQGKPIGAPVASYGPFVMNTQAELMQAFEDYRSTQFGGWPWEDDAPVHAADKGRFAKRPGQGEEKP